MKRLFDYIFYRVYRAYKRRDSNPEIYATNVLALLQFFLLLSAMAIVRFFFDFPNPNKFIVISTLFLLIGINWYQYGFRVDARKFEVEWGEEGENQRKRRGWLIVVSLVGSILLPIVVGVLRHNLGLI
jgi:hypothetical protein